MARIVVSCGVPCQNCPVSVNMSDLCVPRISSTTLTSRVARLAVVSTTSYSVKGADRPAVPGPHHSQMRVVRAVLGPVEGHHDLGRKHSDGKPGHRPSYAIQHVCELKERVQCQLAAIRPGRARGEAAERAPVVPGDDGPVVAGHHRRDGGRGGG